ncbi:MAG: hypothetical protein V1736_14085 [Pseudomonadota bacterium]
MRRKPILVFKTAKPDELEMAENALKEKGIPFFKQQESSSGVRLAMTFQPFMGSGNWFLIFVPRKVAGDAKSALAKLPIKTGKYSITWDSPIPGRMSIWSLSVAVALILALHLYEAFF